MSNKLKAKLSNKSYRDSYAEAQVKLHICKQIRVMREERGWTQKELARRANKPQSVISRVEDPDYGKLSLSTLLKLRSVFDVGLEVRYCEYEKAMNFYRNAAEQNMAVKSYSDDGPVLCAEVYIQRFDNRSNDSGSSHIFFHGGKITKNQGNKIYLGKSERSSNPRSIAGRSSMTLEPAISTSSQQLLRIEQS